MACLQGISFLGFVALLLVAVIVKQESIIRRLRNETAAKKVFHKPTL